MARNCRFPVVLAMGANRQGLDSIQQLQGYLLHTLNGRTDTEGKAIFENIPTGEDVIAIARARHQDMMFAGQPLALSPRQGGHVASVQVFDVSDDKSQLSVKTHHVVMKAHPGSLEITEYMQLKNSCDFAITSSERDNQNRTIVLDIKLPQGFRNLKSLSYFEDQALVVSDDGFYDTMAVPPGEQHAAFSYTLDVPSATRDIVKTISLPTSEFVLFAELGAAKIRGLGQAAEQAMRSSGELMQYYSRNDLSPGDEIAFALTGLEAGSSGLAKWIIAGVVISALAVLVVLRLSPKDEANPQA
ncbi:MAG: hypothetical protein ISS70_16540 [Phycisphaerae bacterium]|nr:hypothetical protein [Phycisphaerae bacterium]